MGSLFYILIALAALATFFILMILVPGNLNKLYIKYILLVYPLMAIDLMPSVLSTNIFSFTTIIFLLVFYKRARLSANDKKSIYRLFFIVLSVVVAAGLILAESLTLTSVTYLMEYTSIFIFSRVLIDECLVDRKFVHEAVNCLKITLFVSLLFMCGQLMFGPSFTIAKSPNINVLSGMHIRYTSFFQDPQKFGQFLSACSFLFLIKSSTEKKWDMINYVLLFLSLVSIFLTGGRGALAGWLLGILFLSFFGEAKFRLAVLLSIIVLGIVAYNYSTSFAIFQRGTDIVDSYNFRYAIWEDAFKIFYDNPFWGIGIGNYANYVSVHNPDQYWINDNVITFFDHPESGYLKLLTEFGVLGFIVILLMIFTPLYKGVILYFKTHRSFHLLLAASLTTWLVGFYTVYSLGDIRILILVATLLSLMIADYKLTTNEVL
ncbi:MAG: O-antigen ligase family protein [bacterium]